MPLPHESVANVLQRFAWHNALDANLMRKGFTASAKGRRIDIEHFAYKSFGQVVLDIYHAERVPARSPWHSDKFRFCPICLQELYHTNLFQCTQLQRCPVHDVLLVTNCQSCGFPTSSSKTDFVFRRPYECDNCGHACAGAEPDLSGHIRLRENVALLESRFDPIATWWADSADERAKIDSMFRAHKRPYYPWPGVDGLLRSLFRGVGSEPSDIWENANDWPQTSRLQWRYRVHLAQSPHCWQLEHEEYMYRYTLRVLIRRIADRLGGSPLELIKELEHFDQGGSENMPAELLALGFMRLQIEGVAGLDDTRILRSVFMAIPSRSNWSNIERYGNRAPRVALFAAYLALFAAWYHLIRRLGWAGSWQFFRHRIPTSEMVLLRSSVWSRRGDKWFKHFTEYCEEAWFDGEAATVGISGLRLFPNHSSFRQLALAPWSGCDVQNE